MGLFQDNRSQTVPVILPSSFIIGLSFYHRRLQGNDAFQMAISLTLVSLAELTVRVGPVLYFREI